MTPPAPFFRDRFGYVFIAAWLAVNLLYLDAVPRSFGDEPWYAGFTIALSEEGSLRHPVIEGRGGIDVAYVQPKFVLNLIALPFVLLWGTSLEVFRVTALVIGAFGLAATYGLSKLLVGRSAARLTLALVATHVWVVICFRTFRPEVAVFTFTMCYAWCIALAAERGVPFFAWLAGAAAAAAVLSQQSGAFFLAAVTVGLSVWVGPRFWRVLPHMWPTLVPALGGYAVYVLAHAGQVEPWTQMVGESQRFEWTPAAVLAKEGARWSNFMAWPAGVPWAAAVFGGACVVWRKQQPGGRAAVVTLAAAVLLVGVFVPISTGRYLVPLVPFMAMVVASGARALGTDVQAAASARRAGLARAVAIAAVVAVVSSSLLQTGVLAFAHRDASYGTLAARLNEAVGDSTRIAGPIAFYLAFPGRTFVPINTSPDFVPNSPAHVAWLREALTGRGVDVVLDSSTDLQSTQGLGPRPTDFARHPLSHTIEELLGDGWRVERTIASRDFGAIRVWKRAGDGHR